MYIVTDRSLGETPSTVPTNCSSVCAGIPEARFEKQPSDLQRVLTQSFKDPKAWLRSRKAIAGEIRRIALILRNYLPYKGGKVRSIVIMFGTGNVATRAEVRLD